MPTSRLTSHSVRAGSSRIASWLPTVNNRSFWCCSKENSYEKQFFDPMEKSNPSLRGRFSIQIDSYLFTAITKCAGPTKTSMSKDLGETGGQLPPSVTPLPGSFKNIHTTPYRRIIVRSPGAKLTWGEIYWCSHRTTSQEATSEAITAVQLAAQVKFPLEWKQWNRSSPLKHSSVVVNRDRSGPSVRYNWCLFLKELGPPVRILCVSAPLFRI